MKSIRGEIRKVKYIYSFRPMHSSKIYTVATSESLYFGDTDLHFQKLLLRPSATSLCVISYACQTLPGNWTQTSANIPWARQAGPPQSIRNENTLQVPRRINKKKSTYRTFVLSKSSGFSSEEKKFFNFFYCVFIWGDACLLSLLW